MYATDVVTQILGLSPGELIDRSFYECIQPNCLDEAEKCLETAKANESIAYLRFWYKDPRTDVNDLSEEEEDDDSDDETDRSGRSDTDAGEARSGDDGMDIDPESGTRLAGVAETAHSRGGSRSPSPCSHRGQAPQAVELEAVVSCTSDGLVVVLRRARPPIPDPQPPIVPAAFHYENGLFAAPWGRQPMEPYISPELLYTFRPPLLPQYMPLLPGVKAAGGPPLDRT